MANARRCQKRSIATLVVLVLLAVNVNSYAQTAIITATATVGVCGDNVKDKSEECDNSDFGGSSCTAFGYDQGSLACNIDCTINSSGCSFDDEEDSGDDDSKTSSNSSGSSASTNSKPTTQTVIIRYVPILPGKLLKYDKNKDDKLDRNELAEVIKKWAENWKNRSSETDEMLENCDVDTNGECSIIDLSVLLYYANN